VGAGVFARTCALAGWPITSSIRRSCLGGRTNRAVGIATTFHMEIDVVRRLLRGGRWRRWGGIGRSVAAALMAKGVANPSDSHPLPVLDIEPKRGTALKSDFQCSGLDGILQVGINQRQHPLHGLPLGTAFSDKIGAQADGHEPTIGPIGDIPLYGDGRLEGAHNSFRTIGPFCRLTRYLPVRAPRPSPTDPLRLRRRLCGSAC
jgi:hypothetical protein